jgi:hypothetical protein
LTWRPDDLTEHDSYGEGFKDVSDEDEFWAMLIYDPSGMKRGQRVRLSCNFGGTLPRNRASAGLHAQLHEGHQQLQRRALSSA